MGVYSGVCKDMDADLRGFACMLIGVYKHTHMPCACVHTKSKHKENVNILIYSAS